MIITIKNFIAELARSTDDPNMIVNTATDWLAIINANGSELSPEVLFEYTTEFAYADLDSTTNEIDMSSDTTYEGLSLIKSIFFENSDGKQIAYYDWSFDKETRIISLTTVDNDNYVSDITSSLVPSSSYPTIKVNWLGEFPTTAGSGSVTMNKSRLSLFRKICVREGTRRILLDHTKLDRYRTLVGRTSTYELLGIIRDMTAEIELEKGKLTNTNTVKVF